jgi:uncharacterized protein YigE (DUF2233 family)
MNRNSIYILTTLAIIAIVGLVIYGQKGPKGNEEFVSYTLDVKRQDLKFYWKDDKQEVLKSISSLKSWLDTKNKTLKFAMNGGMFKKDNTPQGLYIENYKTVTSLDTTSGNGNFYLKPNGVFYITTDNHPVIKKTADFQNSENIKYATQSGPMLVIDGQIHSAFKKGSTNLNVRNGVGILADNKVIFAMSKNEINFYDFANYFKRLGCKTALYLDGFVSRTYLPEQNWTQTDGNFGVIIGVTTNKK